MGVVNGAWFGAGVVEGGDAGFLCDMVVGETCVLTPLCEPTVCIEGVGAGVGYICVWEEWVSVCVREGEVQGKMATQRKGKRRRRCRWRMRPTCC